MEEQDVIHSYRIGNEVLAFINKIKTGQNAPAVQDPILMISRDSAKNL